MGSADNDARRARDYEDRDKSSRRSENDHHRERERDRSEDRHDGRHREKYHGRERRSSRERDDGMDDRRREKYRSSENKDKVSRGDKDERFYEDDETEKHVDHRRMRESVDRERSIGRDGSIERREKRRSVERDEDGKDKASRSSKEERRHRDKDWENHQGHRHRKRDSVDRKRSTGAGGEESFDGREKRQDMDGVLKDRSLLSPKSEKRHGDKEEEEIIDRQKRPMNENTIDRHSLKRKDILVEEKNGKRIRVEEEKHDSPKDYSVEMEKEVSREERRNKGEKQKFQDVMKEDNKESRNLDTSKNMAVKESVDGSRRCDFSEKNKSLTNGVLGIQPMTSSDMREPSTAFNHPSTSKVSPISTTHENVGVSITRSHEVPGKSSTDGTTSAAGKSGSLSLDALAKAKKALQMQKEFSEKLKKLPQLNKPPSVSSAGEQAVSDRVATKSFASSVGNQYGSSGPSISAPIAQNQTSASASTFPVSAATSMKPGADGAPSLLGLPANIEAVKRAQEFAAKLGFRQDPEFAPLLNFLPGQLSVNINVEQKPAKAPVLRLDAQGREIDEHGNVLNLPKLTNLSTLKVNINKQKKEAFQIIRPDLDADAKSNPFYDENMGINKTKLLRPKRMSFQFVEEGKWSKQAEIIRFKSQFGEAQAKELKTKQAQLAKAKAEPDINPNLIEVSERIPVKKEKPKEPIPEIEWWDVLLLQSGAYNDGGGEENKIKKDKITSYVEHPLPIEPPAEPAPPPPQPLKLTKKEQKKLRTQRRLAKEKDRQEMIRQGLLEPPKPKVKMSNLMKVLGAEATQDPTRLEKEICAAAAEREQAHVDRNIARKLTPAERREKKEKKLFDENTLETVVSIYKINDLSHPQTRFKVDVNAQENRLTGCAVITEGLSVVVVEGGTKPIKRYAKLMLRRINWAAAVPDEEKDEENADTLVNKCLLVWQGSVAKTSFNKFLVHQCRTEAAARKVFSDAGVAHYWDLAVDYTGDQI